MPLTAADVENKRFKVVRFREGYDEVDVDSFLDDVAASMRELQARIAELEAKISD